MHYDFLPCHSVFTLLLRHFCIGNIGVDNIIVLLSILSSASTAARRFVFSCNSASCGNGRFASVFAVSNCVLVFASSSLDISSLFLSLFLRKRCLADRCVCSFLFFQLSCLKHLRKSNISVYIQLRYVKRLLLHNQNHCSC